MWIVVWLLSGCAPRDVPETPEEVPAAVEPPVAPTVTCDLWARHLRSLMKADMEDRFSARFAAMQDGADGADELVQDVVDHMFAVVVARCEADGGLSTREDFALCVLEAQDQEALSACQSHPGAGDASLWMRQGALQAQAFMRTPDVARRLEDVADQGQQAQDGVLSLDELGGMGEAEEAIDSPVEEPPPDEEQELSGQP